MQITLKPSERPEQLRSACLIVGAPTKGPLPTIAAALDSASDGVITKLRQRGDLGESAGHTLLVPSLAGIKAERLLLVNLGDSDTPSESDYRKIINAVLAALADHKVADAYWLLPVNVANADSDSALRLLAQQAVIKSYRYTETVSKPKPAFTLRKLTIAADSVASARAAVQQGMAIGNGMNAARRLGDLPANICTPSLLAREAKAMASGGKGAESKAADAKGGKKRGDTKLKVSVLDEKAMAQLGMGALLSVTAGTEQPAKLIVLEYRGGNRTAKPELVVGKGITFDSGGISLKPGAKMDEMKYDMCGAASVIGLFTTVLELQLPINLVGIIAAAENLPSGNATKPGDVVTSMSGQTIEILNTDAEGRLVLCDALTYAARFKPATVIDIATLTGACVVALGKHATGLFSNDDALADALIAAGQRTGDRAWRMPVWDDYQKQLDSNFADIANVGGAAAGSITAACFLARFTKDYRWAHLDIAGTAWDEGANKGASGRPVALLSEYLIQRANTK